MLPCYELLYSTKNTPRADRRPALRSATQVLTLSSYTEFHFEPLSHFSSGFYCVRNVQRDLCGVRWRWRGTTESENVNKMSSPQLKSG